MAKAPPSWTRSSWINTKAGWHYTNLRNHRSIIPPRHCERSEAIQFLPSAVASVIDCAGRLYLLSSAARSIAAIRLVGSALPVPAMLNAVPWSGEVRMIGRPSVVFTP